MKRKFTKPQTNESGLARMLDTKIDEYLQSLTTNEDELVKIMSELTTREVSQDQLKSVNSSYKTYSKTAKDLTDYMKRLK